MPEPDHAIDGGKGVESVELAGEEVAVVLRAGATVSGTTFFTAEHSSLQVGLARYPEGHRVELHEHEFQPRTLSRWAELILPKTGGAVVELVHEGERAEVRLEPGDLIVLYDVAHSFHATDEAEVILVKPGPFHPGDRKRTPGGGASGGVA